MDAFSYLSVLLSIILGLAITQVLQGVRGLLLSREHIRLYPPTLIWAGMILIFATQSWWASFGLKDHQEWTFVEFGIVLVQTTLLYMLAALVLPDFTAGEPHDLQEHYYREAGPFFGVLVAVLLTSLLKDYIIDGHLPMSENLLFHALFIATGAIAIASRKTWLHETLAIVVAVLITLYIALLFSRLG